MLMRWGEEEEGRRGVRWEIGVGDEKQWAVMVRY